MGTPQRSGPKPHALEPKPQREPLDIQPIDPRITPDVDALLQQCSDEGLTARRTLERVDAACGVRLPLTTVVLHLARVAAARIDALRSTIPSFANNIERCEHYIGEVAALSMPLRTLRLLDLEFYLKFSAELRQWVLLQERIAKNALAAQKNVVNVNVLDAEASAELTSRIAGLIARASAGEDPCEPVSGGEDSDSPPMELLGTAEPVTTED